MLIDLDVAIPVDDGLVLHGDIFRPMKMAASVIIADNPTWGLDMGAIQYVHARLLDLSQAGGAVLFDHPPSRRARQAGRSAARALPGTEGPRGRCFRLRHRGAGSGDGWWVRLEVRAWSGEACGRSEPFLAAHSFLLVRCRRRLFRFDSRIRTVPRSREMPPPRHRAAGLGFPSRLLSHPTAPSRGCGSRRYWPRSSAQVLVAPSRRNAASSSPMRSQEPRRRK